MNFGKKQIGTYMITFLILYIVGNGALLYTGMWPIALLIDFILAGSCGVVMLEILVNEIRNNKVDVKDNNAENTDFEVDSYGNEQMYEFDRELVNDYSKDNNEEIIDVQEDLVQNPDIELDSTSKVDSNQMSQASEGRVLTKSKKKLH